MEEKNVTRLTYEDKEIILLGTAHVSKKSAEQVRELIIAEQPDSVCIELDPVRFESIQNKERWQNTDIVKIIKEKKAGFLFVNILLSNYQKKLAAQFGINSGQEMLEGIECAKEIGAELVLADRNVQTTFARIWHNHSGFEKIKLIFSLATEFLEDTEITEEDLERLKETDMLTAALEEVGKAFPKIATPLIYERDSYLAYHIKNAPGNKVVAILGAAHILGVKEKIFKTQNISKLKSIPKKKNSAKYIGWIIPAVIVLMVASTFVVDASSGINQIKSWILWNGTFSALGTAIAFGHPLSILVAFLVAPISSLNPLLAAGWFAGLTEAMVRKPKVIDFENLNDDLSTFKGVWKNKVTRILLIVILANLGSVLGTWIAGVDVFATFFNTLF